MIVIVLVLWAAVSILSSNLSGWAKLTRHYRSYAQFDGIRFRFQSASMRYGTNYGGSVTVGVGRMGLHLSVIFLFRFGHPPLFIPWRDVTTIQEKKFFVRRSVFRFSQCPDVPFIISEKLASRIAEAKGDIGIFEDTTQQRGLRSERDSQIEQR